MLREAPNASWILHGRWLRRRLVFTAGRHVAERGIRRAEHAQFEAEQRTTAVAVLQASGHRTYWWCLDRFYWEAEGLSPDDVYALVHERHTRARRRLQRARDALAQNATAPAPAREPVPTDVRRAVWDRDGGACVQCGERFDLQFDHIIPVVLGGATTIENLQVLCAPCNRAKGAAVA
jgi:HNH endonuclease